MIEAVELVGCHVGRYLAQGMLRIAGHYADGVVLWMASVSREMIQLPLLRATFEGSNTPPTIAGVVTSPLQRIVKPVQHLVAHDSHRFASMHDDSVPADLVGPDRYRKSYDT